MYESDLRVIVHETHASWVFVAGERAYKVKKPLALSFLDYSTLALRRAACREEVRVNRELAPDVYLGVRAIVADGSRFRLADEATPDAIEYCVEMLAFDERESLGGLIGAGSLAPAHVEATALRLAAFHRDAAVVTNWTPERARRAWARNVQELRRLDPPAQWHVEVAAAFGEAFFAAHRETMADRARRGLIRDGHGDLRCEHVLAGPPVRVVDRIEFDAALRQVDVARDLAFLAMDLEALGQHWAARELIGTYRRVGLDPGGEALLAFYAAHCAIVRAKVGLIAGSERAAEASGLWALSERLCWRARGPLALVICGPAASGKSTLAAELARRAEARAISSDAVRKRLAHLKPQERAAPKHYTARFTRATYEQLGRDAMRALDPMVIIDATCRSRSDRAPLLRALQRAEARLLAVRCEVPPALALARAQQRMLDRTRVSDATPEIVAQQIGAFEELTELPAQLVLRLDTAEPLDAQVAAVARALDERLGGT